MKRTQLLPAPALPCTLCPPPPSFDPAAEPGRTTGMGLWAGIVNVAALQGLGRTDPESPVIASGLRGSKGYVNTVSPLITSAAHVARLLHRDHWITNGFTKVISQRVSV